MKKCTKCGINKSLKEFYANKDHRDGKKSSCKECCNKSNKAYYKANPNKWRDWARANPDKRRSALKKWRDKNKDKCRVISRRHNRKRYSTHKGKLNHYMSGAISSSLKRGVKGGRRWMSLVGYTVDQLKIHLEKQFRDGMTWENYGCVWEIDHIIPISAFNFEKPENIDFKRCWSLSNLQPLEVKNNRTKSNKLYQAFQPSLAI